MIYKRLIYHYPLPLREQVSGSQVHVTQMLLAFERLGYEVTFISGGARERSELIQRLKDSYAAGERFDFVYAWSPNSPTLGFKGNLTKPFLDATFFRWCRSKEIPIGLFYGDVHWRFDLLRKRIGLLRYAIIFPLFLFDWMVYLKYIDHLFLPSMNMLPWVPTTWPKDRASELMPGANIQTDSFRNTVVDDSQPLRLFYVGGITPPLYDISRMIEIVQNMEDIILTICCREEEWRGVNNIYPPVHQDTVQIVHAHGEQLDPYYDQADLFGLFWEPYPYLDITMPVKVFESLAHGLPIVTTAGTVAARFVADEDVGWVVENDVEFSNLLTYLKSNRHEIEKKRARIRLVRERHTWNVRAQFIADVMKRYYPAE